METMSRRARKFERRTKPLACRLGWVKEILAASGLLMQYCQVKYFDTKRSRCLFANDEYLRCLKKKDGSEEACKAAMQFYYRECVPTWVCFSYEFYRKTRGFLISSWLGRIFGFETKGKSINEVQSQTSVFLRLQQHRLKVGSQIQQSSV